ncbi:MAG: hypothetical protein HQL57_11835, partial [Magnetococcales bacterium]|nr:hypothetical protein [Magnetococcales bacterium]
MSDTVGLPSPEHSGADTGRDVVSSDGSSPGGAIAGSAVPDSPRPDVPGSDTPRGFPFLVSWFRWAVRLALVTLALLASLPLALIVAWQSPAFQRWSVAAIEQRFADPRGSLVLSGLQGEFPFRVRLAAITFRDAQGPWLEARNLRLAWSLAGITDGLLRVDEAYAERLVIHRSPSGGGGSSSPDASAARPDSSREGLIRRYSWWRHLPALRLERFRVEELELGASLIGQTARFRLAGGLSGQSASTSPVGQTAPALGDLTMVAIARATVERLDRPGASLDFQAEWDGRSGIVTLDLTAREGSGLIAELAGGAVDAPLTVTLHGRGPPSLWQGEAQMERPGWGKVTSTITFRADGHDPRCQLRGRWLSPGTGVPPGLAALIAEGILPFSLELTADRTTGEVRLERGEWSGRGWQAAGQGGLSLAAAGVDGSLGVAIADVAPFSSLVALPLT